jgi:pimeloyl-ACP methyl ester carboxylesterase
MPWFDATAAAVELEQCELSGSHGVGRVEAMCGRLARPEDPDAPESAQLDLFIAKIPSLSPEPAPDAFTIVNGGPGGSSVSLFVDLSHAFSGILRERDIILVDQRGTGRSNPLECPELEKATEDYSLEAVQEATRVCLESLAGDPRFYTTSQAVEDLEAVRAALGYESLNVYGVSYGTRVSMHYVRRHPDRVRTLILDGVVPPELALGVNVAENAQKRLEELFTQCARAPECSEAFPDLKARFRQLQDDLAGQQISLRFPNPVTGLEESLTFGYDHLALVVRLLSYAPETASLLPLIIDQAAGGNYLPAASQALRITDALSGTMSFGMHNSVTCTEDLPFIDFGEVDWAALEATYIGADQVRALRAICEIWPRADMDPDLKAPLEAETPTLILSGELDPITPPAYGEQVAPGLSNSMHIVGAGQGHGIVSRGCVPRLVTQMVEAGHLRNLDASCTQRLSATPFFIDLMGPAP